MINRQASSSLLANAQFLSSPYFDARPPQANIDLLVIHCISLPPEQYGACYVEDLFLGKLDCSLHPYFKQLQSVRVSAHLYIKRDGQLIQFVPFDKRAWHAGLSEFAGQNRCNDFSIGIELEGDVNHAYTSAQYQCLVKVTAQLQQCYPAITQDRIVGHSDIAPIRKDDPGPHFDWQHYFACLNLKDL